MLKIAALIANLSIVFCEAYALGHIRRKSDVLKYYTYLQNFLALIASLIFSFCSIVCLITGKPIPELAKGLRYMAASGLAATAFIFIAFLGAGKKIALTEDDFLPGLKPRSANILLHYVCPALALASFILLERDARITHDFWTGIVALPSCIYWILYMILSAAKLWEEPYNFSSGKGKTGILDVLTVVLIPLSFIAISFVLWNIM